MFITASLEMGGRNMLWVLCRPPCASQLVQRGWIAKRHYVMCVKMNQTRRHTLIFYGTQQINNFWLLLFLVLSSDAFSLYL